MSALAFDTHAFVKRLTAAGMPEAQAEVLADQQAKLIDEKLATKADLAELGRATKADFTELARATKADFAELARVAKTDLVETERQLKANLAETTKQLKFELEAKIEAAKLDMVKWMFGTIGFQTVIILGAVIALARVAHL